MGKKDTLIRIWDLDIEGFEGDSPRTVQPPLRLGLTLHPIGISPVAQLNTVHYTNAKVVLVGETSVGKSALSLVLAGRPFTPTESTHGRYVWTLESNEIQVEGRIAEAREILLWDLAGQPGYRVFHRQHLDEVTVALVLFDSRSETDPFAGVAYWARALDEAAREFPMVKYLVAARIDRGEPQVSSKRIKEICDRYGFSGFFNSLSTPISWSLKPTLNQPIL